MDTVTHLRSSFLETQYQIKLSHLTCTNIMRTSAVVLAMKLILMQVYEVNMINFTSMTTVLSTRSNRVLPT